MNGFIRTVLELEGGVSGGLLLLKMGSQGVCCCCGLCQTPGEVSCEHMVTFCCSPVVRKVLGYHPLVQCWGCPIPNISLPPSRNMALLPIKQLWHGNLLGRERFGLKAFLESGGCWDAGTRLLDEHRLIHKLSASSGPSLSGFTAAKYFKRCIFITVCCSPTHQILGLFKEVLGAAPGMNMAPLRGEKSQYGKLLYFPFGAPLVRGDVTVPGSRAAGCRFWSIKP